MINTKSPVKMWFKLKLDTGTVVDQLCLSTGTCRRSRNRPFRAAPAPAIKRAAPQHCLGQGTESWMNYTYFPCHFFTAAMAACWQKREEFRPVVFIRLGKIYIYTGTAGYRMETQPLRVRPYLIYVANKLNRSVSHTSIFRRVIKLILKKFNF